MGSMERWARWTYRNRWLVLGTWVAAVVGVTLAARAWGGSFGTEFRLPGSESVRALELLEERFPARAGSEADIVFEAPGGIEGQRAAIEAVLAELLTVPGAAEVESPFERPGYVSPDGTIARAVLRFAVPHDEVTREMTKEVLRIVDSHNSATLRVEAGGEAVRFNEIEEFGSEVAGLIAAVFILLIAFGSVVAMGLPIGAALLGLGAGFGILGLATRFIGLPEFTPQFAAMIGIGVGIDYSLLVVTRFREGLHTGKSVEDAVATAVTTAGRSVVFAGVVVAISFLGLYVMGIPAIAALGLGGAIVVLVAVGIAVSATPAALSVIGHRVDRLRVPFLHQSEGIDPRSPWFRLSRAIQRRPWPYAIGSTGILLLLAAPVLTMNLGFTDAGNGSEKLHSRRAYDLLAKGFGPGFNGPLVVVVDMANGGVDGLDEAAARFAATPGVAAVAPAVVNPEGDTAIITVIPASSPQAKETTDLVHRLRDEVVPGLAQPEVRYYVSGATAGNIDAAELIQRRMLLLFAGVIGFSFILLTAVFRSVVVALKAAVMNLLSIGAAYGVVVAIFQWGWFGDLIGVGEGPVEVFLPTMMFAILFGLSMDYEVFLISRIREEYLRTGSTNEAVANGLTATARVITAAAAIMVTVFLAFVLGPNRIIKEFGIGLATAIFVDATIVRIFLVPSAMELLGKANWWMPGWLDRLLPKLHLEGPPEGELAGTPATGR